MRCLSDRFGRVLVISLAAAFVAIWVVGCDNNPSFPPDPIIVVPEHTLRDHAGVSHPVITPNGEKVIINGNLLKTYSSENVLVNEVELELPDSWNTFRSYPRIHQDVDGNLYLSFRDRMPDINELVAVNDAGEILWTVETSGYWEPEFPSDGGVLYWFWTETERVLTKLDSGGNEVWSRLQLPGEDQVAYFILEANRIYVLDNENLVALELDGSEIWRAPVGDGETFFPNIGSSGNLTVVVNRYLIQAFNEAGAEIWSVPIPSEFRDFRGVLVFNENKSIINLEGQSGSGFLVLDGSGNQINLFAGDIVVQMTAVDDSRFLAWKSEYPHEFVALFNADTGAVVWQYQLPAVIMNSPKNEGDIVDEYHNAYSLSFTQNDMVYVDRNSTLIELNLSGEQTAAFNSSVSEDTWVESEWAIPWDII